MGCNAPVMRSSTACTVIQLFASTLTLACLECEPSHDLESADAPAPSAVAASDDGPRARGTSDGGAAAVPALTDEELDRLLDALEEELRKVR